MIETPQTQHMAPAALPEVPGVGETLSRARCSIGLSVEDVASQLKFSLRQIDALEKGRYDELPKGAIARGMVRSYARLLKLDADTLLQRVGASLPSPSAIETAVPFRKPIPFSDTSRHVNLRYAVLSVLVLAAMAVVVLDWPGGQSADSKLSFVAPGRMTDTTGVAQAPVAPESVPVAAAGAPIASIVPPPVSPEAAAPAPAAAPAAHGERRLTLQFEGASWVEVRGGDGQIITSQINAAGTTRVVEGRPPFQLVIGNAGKVRLSYGERTIDLSRHARLDVARVTLE